MRVKLLISYKYLFVCLYASDDGFNKLVELPVKYPIISEMKQTVQPCYIQYIANGSTTTTYHLT